MYPYEINYHLLVLGNEYFHIYLVRGQQACALVETGVSATSDIIIEQLSSLGIKPAYLVVTHPHSDHITGLDALKTAFPHVTVMAAGDAESFLTHPKAVQALITEDKHIIDVMNARGFCSDARAILSSPSLAGCRVVNDGEELDLGECKITFLEAKGHSPGNILVHIPDLKTVLASDSLGNHYPGRGFFPTFFTGYADYIHTIDRLQKLSPEILGLAHNGFVLDKHEIERTFQTARRCAGDVKNYIIHDERNDEDIAQDLFRFYYTDELAVYSPQNILSCCRLLVRRVREI